MYRKLVLTVMAVLPLGVLVAPAPTNAALPVFANANEPVHCDDFVGQVVFKTPLKDGGATPGQAVWTAVSNDCHDQNVGEYDVDGNPGGVSLKRATVKGTFDYSANDCSLLQGGGTFLGGQLTVHWTTRPDTPTLANRTTTISYPQLGWDWGRWLGNGDFLHLTLGIGSLPAPTVTGGFAGIDAGSQSRLETVISQSYGSLLRGDACSTTGIRKITFGIGYFLLA